MKFIAGFLMFSLLFSCGRDNLNRKSAGIRDKNGVGYKTEISSFIPEGYDILDTISGDLNLDNFPDMILVLKKVNEKELSDEADYPIRRPLYILTGQKDYTYKQVVNTDKVIYCLDCGGAAGDPYKGISINKGMFKINQEGGEDGRWRRGLVFIYSEKDNNWYLDEDRVITTNKEGSQVKILNNFEKISIDRFDLHGKYNSDNTKK